MRITTPRTPIKINPAETSIYRTNLKVPDFSTRQILITTKYRSNGWNESFNESSTVIRFYEAIPSLLQIRYRRFTDLKTKNPRLKTLLAVGGRNHSAKLFTKAVENGSTREKLIISVMNLLRKYGFDGFDLDWEYPGSRGSPPHDKKKFTLLIKVRFLLVIFRSSLRSRMLCYKKRPMISFISISQQVDFVAAATSFSAPSIWNHIRPKVSATEQPSYRDL